MSLSEHYAEVQSFRYIHYGHNFAIYTVANILGTMLMWDVTELTDKTEVLYTRYMYVYIYILQHKHVTYLYMSRAMPKSAIFATLPGPFFVSRQFRAAMSLLR